MSARPVSRWACTLTHHTANPSFVTCYTLVTHPVSGLETFLGAVKHLAITNLSSHEYICLSSECGVMQQPQWKLAD